MTDKAVRDSETINVRFAKMQDELDSVTYNHERLKKDFMKRANEIRVNYLKKNLVLIIMINYNLSSKKKKWPD